MDQKQSWQIKPAGKLSLPDLSEIWNYRDLLMRFVKKDWIITYRQTILGPLWVVLEPVVATLVYLGIFTGILNLSYGNTPPILFYLSGVIIWIYFSDSVNIISSVFLHNRVLLSKVYFPRLILPLSYVLSRLSRLAIQLLLFVVVYIVYLLLGSTIKVDWHIIFVPLILAILVAFTFASGLILAALSAKYRDVQNLLLFLLRLMMFATPVFYPFSAVNNNLKTIIALNPLTAILESFRFVLFGEGVFDTQGLIYAAISTLILLFVGLYYFGRVEQNVVDTI